MNAVHVSERAFFAVAVLLFTSSAAVTITWCASMSAMGGMPMPGGWTMSMAWMRMPGHTWLDAGASFLAMWFAMMVAMMLPSLVPMLRRYRQAVGGRDPGLPTTIVGVAYFAVWTAFGAAVFPLGAGLAALEMQVTALAVAVPIATGVVVLLAGALQFTGWKLRQLACCRSPEGHESALPATLGAAWRHGVRLGFHCCCCCVGPMTVLLVIGVMDLFTMAVVTVAITAERLAPGARVARLVGALGIGAGLLLIAVA